MQMVSSLDVRKEIVKVLRQDATILQLMDLTGKPQLDIAKSITHKSRYDGKPNGATRAILVTNRPDTATANEALRRKVVEVQCHMTEAQSDNVERVIERVRALIDEQTLIGAYLLYSGDLPDLPTLPDFYCSAIRFKYYVR